MGIGGGIGCFAKRLHFNGRVCFALVSGRGLAALGESWVDERSRLELS